MTRRNRVPESVSMETPKAKRAEEQRRRQIQERKRAEDRPSVSANTPAARREKARVSEEARLSTGVRIPFTDIRVGAVPKERWDRMTWEERDEVLRGRQDAMEMAASTAAVPGMILRAGPKAIQSAEALLKARGTTWAKSPRELKLEIKRTTGAENYLGQWVRETQDPVLEASVRQDLDAGRLDRSYGSLSEFFDLPADLRRSKALKHTSVSLNPRANRTPGQYGEFEPMTGGISIETREPRMVDPTGTLRRPASAVEQTGVHEIQHRLDRVPGGLGVMKGGDLAVERRLGPYVGHPTETRAFNVEYRHRYMSPEERASSLLEDTTEAIFSREPVRVEALGKKSLLRKALGRQDAKGGYEDRFAMSRNFLATDKVPDSIFGYPIVSHREDYTPEDIAFFRAHPEAGGYYDLGEGSPEDGTDEKDKGVLRRDQL